MPDGMSDMLAAALVLAARGWPVFPCGSVGDKAKQPLTPHGFKDATTSEPTIRHWWRRWPDAAVGIPTGERSGFWALDVDTKHGKPGDDSLDLLENQHGRLPDTVEVLTASGGRHLWFAWDPAAEIRNSAEALGPGLDVRGEGGYVIAPPSLVDGRRYAFEGSSDPDDGVALAQAPDWLVKLALAHSRRPPSLASATTNDGAARITAGNRNDTLFRLASSLRAKGLNASAILAAIRAENLERCEPPLAEEEVDRIAESASKFEQGEIRTGTDGATVTTIDCSN